MNRLYSIAFARWLTQTNPAWFSLVSMLAAFSAYFCMYAFRKPFSAGTYEGMTIGGLNYKIALVIIQVCGYMFSKLIGVKVVSEMPPHYRAGAIVMLIVIAELALLGFGTVPYPYNALMLFLNGLPLGMVWGLVFGFLEGRRTTELLSAGFATSIILASGVTKSVGRLLIDAGVAEFWMPALTGSLFLPFLLVSVWVLWHLPPPTPEDEAARTRRVPMDARARWHFFRSLALGLIMLVLTYMLLSLYRDYRDNFGVELWRAVGITDSTIFAHSESIITVVVLLLLGGMIFVRSNQLAFWLNHGLIVLGGLIILGAVAGYERGWLSGYAFMLLSGTGLFLAYLLFHCMTFERLIAVFRQQATVGFLFYLADSTGYVSSVVLLLVKNFGYTHMDWLVFFRQISYVVGFGVIGLSSTSFLYFYHEVHRRFPAPDPAVPALT